MTGSYFRGDAVAFLAPQDETRFETVTYKHNFGARYGSHLERGAKGCCVVNAPAISFSALDYALG
jgi:hypothetical protein